METPKSDAPKLPNMVMSGDHRSFTKTELNEKEIKPDDKDKENLKERMPMSYARISPTSSRTERERVGAVGAEGAAERARAASEHALRLLEARRRGRSLEALEALQRPDPPPPDRALVQAAMVSFRWPPYLLAAWVALLAAAHALHALAAALDRALPALRKLCQYFRTWTEDSWKSDTNINHRVFPIGLACLTGLLYTLYFGLYAIYSVTLWSIEPLCAEVDDKRSPIEAGEVKITNYVAEVNSQTNSSIKQ